MCWLCEKTKGIAKLDDCKVEWDGNYIHCRDFWLYSHSYYSIFRFVWRLYVKLLFFLRKKFHKKEMQKTVIETKIKPYKARYYWTKGRFAYENESGWRITNVDVVYGIEKINDEFYVYRKIPRFWKMRPPAEKKQSYKIDIRDVLLACMSGEDEMIINVFEKQKSKGGKERWQ